METYGEHAVKEATTVLGHGWRLVETRQEEAVDSPPQNAYAVVCNQDLHLRFVRDRGIEHLDVRCLGPADAHRWVPFETVGLAAGLWTEADFEKSLSEWCGTPKFKDGTIRPISLFDSPLSRIQQNHDDIARVANDPQAVRDAEDFVSQVTSEILEAASGDPGI